jgi:hypothetical protein
LAGFCLYLGTVTEHKSHFKKNDLSNFLVLTEKSSVADPDHFDADPNPDPTSEKKTGSGSDL